MSRISDNPGIQIKKQKTRKRARLRALENVENRKAVEEKFAAKRKANKPPEPVTPQTPVTREGLLSGG